MNVIQLLKVIAEHLSSGGNPSDDMYLRIRTRDAHDNVRCVSKFKVSDVRILENFEICAEESSKEIINS